MGRPALPTLPRILLACALLAWVALATRADLSPLSVWAVVGVGLVGLASFEALGRRQSSSPRDQRKAPDPLPRPPLQPPGVSPSGGIADWLHPFSPLPPPRALLPALTSRIDLPSSDASKGFARLTPFGDEREVIVRRTPATAHDYGMEQGRRLVTIAGHEFLVVSYRQLLSPPVLRPGQPLMSPEAARSYEPEFDVLYLPDAEVLMQRQPRGFSDAEVAQILAAISLAPLPAPAAAERGPSESPELAVARLRARASTSHELKQAIAVVGGSRPVGAIPLLRSYLRNTDLTVVEAACQALARLGAREASAELMDLLRPEAEQERTIDSSGDPFGWYEAPPRASALYALTVLRVTEAAPAVRRLLRDVDPEVQRLARNYLETLGLNVEG